jgi:hypothetical protein
LLDVQNCYSLFTPSIDSVILEHNGLEMLDAVEASDHLPLVADFIITDITSTDENFGTNIKSQLELFQNYPNPFNPVTWIEYRLPSSRFGNSNYYSDNGISVNLDIYDTAGNKVKTLVNRKLFPGKYKTVFDASNYSSGIYYYSLAWNNSRIVKKMILLK